MDLLGGSFFALDGLRLPSNASKEWSGTRSGLRRMERLEAKVKELLTDYVQKAWSRRVSPKFKKK